MYICICNALKEKDFRNACSKRCKATCAEELFEALDAKPVCGSCLCMVDNFLPLGAEARV